MNSVIPLLLVMVGTALGQLNFNQYLPLNVKKHSCRDTNTCPLKYTEAELRGRLTDLQYRVTRESATERPYQRGYDNHKEGEYLCRVCNNTLFSSKHKYDSGTGWPSFYDVIGTDIGIIEDYSHGMHRYEVTCERCGSHIGHVFTDGPLPTGLRYCMNLAALLFVPQQFSRDRITPEPFGK